MVQNNKGHLAPEVTIVGFISGPFLIGKTLLLYSYIKQLKNIMNPNLINEMKAKLLEEKARVEQELSSVSKHDTAGRVPGDAEATFPKYGDSVEENTDEVITYQENLSATSNIEKHLEKIEAALERMEEGTYGTCSKCGVEISEDRLRAFPPAETCVDCSRKL